MLISQVAVLLECPVDEFFKLYREIRIEAHWRGRRPIQDSFEDYARSISAKWQCASSHLVQCDSKRKQVGSRIQFLAPNLLGRHVRNGPNCRAGAGEYLVCGDRRAYRCANAFRRLTKLRQSEIENLRVAALSEKDVRGLNVAVNNSFRMGGIESIRDLDS